jgi:hypothetical protein
MTAEAEEKMCSKCKEQPAGTQVWCKSCRAKYQREYREQEAEMLGARNWIAGANAIRAAMATQLDRAGNAVYQGNSIARWIREFEVPEYPKVPKGTDSAGEPV